MKKLLFLLLCAVTMHGQTYQNPTFGTVTEKTNTADTTPAFFVTTQTDGVHKKTASALIAKTATVNDSLALKANKTDVTLQKAYEENSLITTSSIDGAVAIRRGSAADTDAIIVGQNGAGTVTSSVKGNGEIYTAATPTATAFSHYHGQTASDGIVRPKTIANVRTEIVTTAAVDSAKPNILTGTGTINTILKSTGTNTYGNSNLSDNGTIITSSTDLSVNGLRVGRGSGNISTNVALGNNALTSVTTSDFNVAIGQNALQYQSNGGSNMAIGGNSMQNATGGIGNSALGVGALNGLSTGNSNVSLGNSSMFFAGNSNDNTSVGATSLYRLVNSNGNTAIGFDSGRYVAGGGNLTTSTNSIFIGKGSKAGADSQDNQIVIGYNSEGLGSNTSVFGNSSTLYSRMWGNFLVGTSTNNGNAGRFAGKVDVNKLQLNTTPATASGTPPLLTWNSTTKDVESVPYATFAPTASPALTGTPTAPTATAGTNTTQIATTAFVKNAVDNRWTVTGGLDIYATDSNSGNPYTERVFVGTSTPLISNAKFQVKGNIYSDAFVYGNSFNSSLFQDVTAGTKLQVISGSWVANKQILAPTLNTTGYTVATLPAGVTGATAYVTDATAPTYLGTLTGGGSVVCPVFYNGTAWVSH